MSVYVCVCVCVGRLGVRADLVVPTTSPVTSDFRVHGWEWLAPTLRIKATLGAPLGFQEPFPSTPTVPNQPTI
jgi:hypothetical protein